MKKIENDFDRRSAFDDAKKILERMFPQVSKKAFYINGLKESGVLPVGMTNVAVSAVCEIEGDAVNLRIYRRPETGSYLQYKVDERRAVNKQISYIPSPRAIENHHLKHQVPEDMMERNHMSVEFIGDGKGGLKPNVQPDGTVKTYINFPDPIEEFLKKTLKRVSDT